MAVGHDMRVKLSEEAFQYIQAKVSSGDYSSESDVLSQGVALLQQKDREFEAWQNEGDLNQVDASGEMIIDPFQAQWEQEVLLPALAELEANPDAVLTDKELGASLAKARMERCVRA